MADIGNNNHGKSTNYRAGSLGYKKVLPRILQQPLPNYVLSFFTCPGCDDRLTQILDKATTPWTNPNASLF